MTEAIAQSNNLYPHRTPWWFPQDAAMRQLIADRAMQAVYTPEGLAALSTHRNDIIGELLQDPEVLEWAAEQETDIDLPTQSAEDKRARAYYYVSRALVAIAQVLKDDELGGKNDKDILAQYGLRPHVLKHALSHYIDLSKTERRPWETVRYPWIRWVYADMTRFSTETDQLQLVAALGEWMSREQRWSDWKEHTFALLATGLGYYLDPNQAPSSLPTAVKEAGLDLLVHLASDGSGDDWDIQDRLARPLLQPESTSPATRLRAAQMLSTIATRVEFIHQDVGPSLAAAALADPDPAVRAEASQALQSLAEDPVFFEFAVAVMPSRYGAQASTIAQAELKSQPGEYHGNCDMHREIVDYLKTHYASSITYSQEEYGPLTVDIEKHPLWGMLAVFINMVTSDELGTETKINNLLFTRTSYGFCSFKFE